MSGGRKGLYVLSALNDRRSEQGAGRIVMLSDSALPNVDVEVDEWSPKPSRGDSDMLASF
jgi:hypothetical protein